MNVILNEAKWSEESSQFLLSWRSEASIGFSEFFNLLLKFYAGGVKRFPLYLYLISMYGDETHRR